MIELSDRLKIRQLSFFILIIVLFTLVSPIISSQKKKNPRVGRWLIDCIYSDADVLNPILSTDSSSSYIESFIFEGLLVNDRNMQLVPQLAMSWQISSNKLDYTFSLRQDVYWHDNEPFTAGDVIFTWDRILDPRTNGTKNPLSDFLDLENVPYEKLDNYTITFHLKTAFSSMLGEMVFPIIPKHIFEQYSPLEGGGDYQFNDCLPNYTPVGTGSMMFDEWIRDNQTVLIRNSRANSGPGYWREHDAYLEGVIIKVIPDVTTQLLTLKNGDIDKMDLSSAEHSEVETLQLNENFIIYTAPQFSSDHIAFNCDPSKGHHATIRDFNEEPNLFGGFEWQEPDPLKLPGSNIRKALNYAFDKELFLSVAYPYGYRNKGPMYLAHTYWYNDDVNPYEVNITKANELLGKAGYGYTKDDPLRKLLNFTISYSTNRNRCQTVCNHAKSQWETALGIGVKVEVVEGISMLNSHYDNRMFDVMSTGWTGDGLDPDLTNIWHSKNIMPDGYPIGFDLDTYVWEWEGDPMPGGLNYAGYWNPEVDNLLDIARNEPEKVVCKMYYDQIQEMVVNDSPYIWLFAHVTLWAVRSNVHGLIQDSVAGLWPPPVGFHNVWKSDNTAETTIQTITQSTIETLIVLVACIFTTASVYIMNRFRRRNSVEKNGLNSKRSEIRSEVVEK